MSLHDLVLGFPDAARIAITEEPENGDGIEEFGPAERRGEVGDTAAGGSVALISEAAAGPCFNWSAISGSRGSVVRVKSPCITAK